MQSESGQTKPILPELPTLAALLVAALAYRVIAVAVINRIVWGDEPFYLWLGRNWLTGRGYTFTGYSDVHHTPLFPLLSGLGYLVTGNLETASNLVYVVFGALLVVPIYLIANELYNRTAAVVAGILVSVWPAITVAVLYWGTMTEPPYLFFIYSGIYGGLLVLRHRRGLLALLAGASLALAYLTRPEAIGYLVAVAVVVGLVHLLERRLFQPRVLIGGVGLVLVGYLLLFMPYAYYVRQHTGQWMVSEKAGVTYVTSKSLAYGDTVTFDKMTWGLDTAGTEVYFFSPESYNVSIVQVIRQDPWDFARLVYMNVRRFADSLLSVRLFPFWLVPLVVLGWLKESWDRRRLKAEFYLLAAISPVLGFLIFFIQDRYILAIVPGLVIWAAAGITVAGAWLAQTVRNLIPSVRSGRLAAAAAALPVLVVLAYLATTAPTVDAAAHSGSWRLEHRTVGLWMRDNLPPGGTVMTRYPAIAFYAEKHWVPTPNASTVDALRYARIKNATYWVLDERETLKLRPQYAPLLAAPRSAGLEPVYEDTSTRERLVVFRIVQP